MIPKSSFTNEDTGELLVGWKKYVQEKAPCVCADGHSYYDGTHGDMHTRYGVVAMHNKDNWNREKATKAGAKSVTKTFPECKDSQACLETQLNNFHDKARTAKPDKPIRATHPMEADETKRNAARKLMEVPIPGASTR